MTTTTTIAAMHAADDEDGRRDLPHVRALCAAIDAGDDTALPILADALEECGEERLAAGLRRVASRPSMGPLWLVERDCRPIRLGEGYGWHAGIDLPHTGTRKGQIPTRLLVSLEGGRGAVYEWEWPNGATTNTTARAYPTRSAAFLALAKAIA